MERLRSGERIEISLSSGGTGYSLKVDESSVWVFGCDCASSADVAEVQAIHDALGAWLRIQRSKP
jgi:hypothetical protein